MTILSSVNELLTHIKEVEQDTIKFSQDSMLILSELIEKNSIELDEDTVKALQYQDIISQQLSATIDAIESVQTSINMFEVAYKTDEKVASDSLDKLQNKLSNALSLARGKREAFSGNIHSDEDSIEFF